MTQDDKGPRLLAALRVFASEGYHASRVESLSDAMALPWDELCAQYGDKEGLFYAALEYASAVTGEVAAPEL